MKMLLGFFIGTTVALLAMFVFYNNTSSVSADTPTETVSPDTSTLTPADISGETLDVNGLMPDVGKIYRVALGEPYRVVESEITDPEIANYFHVYMAKTGLDKIGADQ
jgi:hypothetical protein